MTDTFRYEDAVNAVRAAAQARKAEDAPPSIVRLVIEETFSLLHHGALYSGMGEEALTAAFASTLAAAGTMWQRHWIWKEGMGEEHILLNHYNKKSETVLGADFSLIFVDVDQDGPKYRLIISQAKRHTAEEPERVHVRREAFSATRGQKVPEDWEELATSRLTAALNGQTLEPQDIAPKAVNYQLTRLLDLRNRLSDAGVPAGYVYVIWPAKPGSDKGPFHPVWYEELSVAGDEIKGMLNPGTRKYTQSFELDTKRHFRDYLLGYDTIGSMSEDDLVKVLDIIKGESAATILINASGKPLSPNVANQLKIANKPDYVPAASKKKTPDIKY